MKKCNLLVSFLELTTSISKKSSNRGVFQISQSDLPQWFNCILKNRQRYEYDY